MSQLCVPWCCLTPPCLGLLFSKSELMIPQFSALLLALIPEDTPWRTGSEPWEGLRAEELTSSYLEQLSALPDYRRFHEAEATESQTPHIHWTVLFMTLKELDLEACTQDMEVYSWPSKRSSFGGRYEQGRLILQWPPTAPGPMH